MQHVTSSGHSPVVPPTTTYYFVGNVQWTATMLEAARCDGCGFAWLTACANPFYPHNPEVCAAYRRGYEAGKAEGK